MTNIFSLFSVVTSAIKLDIFVYMKRKYTFVLTVLIGFLAMTAKAQKTEMPIVWYYNYFIGQDTLQFGKTYVDAKQRPYKLERFQFYTSGIALIDTDNDTLHLTDSYVLSTGTDGGHDLGKHQVGKLSSIKFDLGVDPAANHSDPSTYPAHHALAHQNPSMHWGWESGYRFWVVEGWLDDDKDGKFDIRFEYHAIGDDLLKTKRLSTAGIEKDNKLFVVLNMQVDQLFDSIDFAVNNVVHAGPWDKEAGPIIKMAENAAGQRVFTSGTGFNLSLNQPLLNKVQVYPNPCHKTTTLFIQDPSKIKQIDVINSSGQTEQVFTSFSQNALSLALDKGVYFVQISHTNHQVTRYKVVSLE